MFSFRFDSELNSHWTYCPDCFWHAICSIFTIDSSNSVGLVGVLVEHPQKICLNVAWSNLANFLVTYLPLASRPSWDWSDQFRQGSSLRLRLTVGQVDGRRAFVTSRSRSGDKSIFYNQTNIPVARKFWQPTDRMMSYKEREFPYPCDICSELWTAQPPCSHSVPHFYGIWRLGIPETCPTGMCMCKALRADIQIQHPEVVDVPATEFWSQYRERIAENPNLVWGQIKVFDLLEQPSKMFLMF